MFLFLLLSPLNLLLIFLSLGLAYFHWALPLLFIVCDVVFVYSKERKCPLCKKSFVAHENQTPPVSHKRKFVWYKNRSLRKRLCQFEELCWQVQNDILQVDLYGNTAVIDNMKSVLLQLRGEFVDALYEYSVISKKKKQNGNLQYIEQKLSSIEERLQTLRHSVDIAQANHKKISELSGAMANMGKSVLEKLKLDQ